MLHLVDQPDGTVIPSMNVTALHGVLSTLELKETGDMVQARAVRNPDVGPHLLLVDLGGHGYDLVPATRDQLSTAFVCKPRPYKRSESPDGGPLVDRVVHRTNLWKAGEATTIEQEILEGNPQYLSYCLRIPAYGYMASRAIEIEGSDKKLPVSSGYFSCTNSLLVLRWG